METGILTYKWALKPGMKWLLIISGLLRWNWLIKKCYSIELVTGDTAELKGSR